MGVKVSVIIPVYNSEKYLAETIESLLNQTLKECEFIFINDGSKDNSLNILEKYKEKDSRIIVISQENKGVSEARNRGLEIAKGEYIGFVDGDDYIQNDMYERLYDLAVKKNCDIIISNFSNGSFPFKVNEELNKTYIKENIYPYFLRSDGFNSVCNKIFKRSIINQNKIIFPSGVALGEDGVFNMKIFTYCKNAYYTSYNGYFYREREGSATRSIKGKDLFKRSLEVYKEPLKEFKLWEIKESDINRLKSIKLINSSINYTYIYLRKNNELSFKIRYSYVKNMINNKHLIEVLNLGYEEVYKEKGRYERFILKMIKNKNALGILIATKYSEYRNGK